MFRKTVYGHVSVHSLLRPIEWSDSQGLASIGRILAICNVWPWRTA